MNCGMDADKLAERLVTEESAYKRIPSETLFRLGSTRCSACNIEIIRGIDKEEERSQDEKDDKKGKVVKRREDKCGWFGYYGLNSFLLCCTCAHAQGWAFFEQAACRYCKTRQLHKAPPKKPSQPEYAALERLRWWASSDAAHRERLAQSRQRVKEEEMRLQGVLPEEQDDHAKRRQVVHQFNLQKELWK